MCAGEQGRQPGLQMRMHWLISGTHSTTASAVPASIASVTSVINLFSAGYNQEGYNAPSAHGVAQRGMFAKWYAR